MFEAGPGEELCLTFHEFDLELARVQISRLVKAMRVDELDHYFMIAPFVGDVPGRVYHKDVRE